MQTLGISNEPRKTDNWFKRVFWASDDPSEVDGLSQQGFWLCMVIAVLTLAVSAAQGHPLMGLLAAAVFFLGGVGVREHSIGAASVIALVYLFSMFAGMLVLRRPPGLLDLFAMLLLASNVRGTWIASKWSRVLPPEEQPLRFNESWRDKLVDQMPAKVWPKAKIIFFILAGIYWLLVTFGTMVLLARLLHARS